MHLRSLPIGSIFMPLSRHNLQLGQLSPRCHSSLSPSAPQFPLISILLLLQLLQIQLHRGTSKCGSPCTHSWAQKPWRTFHVTDFLKANQLPPFYIQFSGPSFSQLVSQVPFKYSLTLAHTHSQLSIMLFMQLQ